MHHFQYAYCTHGLSHESFGLVGEDVTGLSEAIVKLTPNHSEFSKQGNAQIHKSSQHFSTTVFFQSNGE